MQSAPFAAATFARRQRLLAPTPIVPEQAPIVRVDATFPDAERAARHAVHIWFSGKLDESLIEFRDVRCREHCARHEDGALRHHMRMTAFERAFAEEVGRIIVERRHVWPIT